MTQHSNISNKKTKPLFKKISLPPYSRDVLFTIGSSKEEISEYILSKFGYALSAVDLDNLSLDKKVGRAVLLENKAFVLWSRDGYIPVICHEIFHVVEILMQSISCPLNNDTAEPYAYLIEHLTAEIFNKNQYLK